MTLTGSLNSTNTNYLQQVAYFPQGSVYYWQYGNNVWPVETYTKNLQPYTNYATVGNSASSYLMFLQDNWTTNGLVGSGQECYGAAVTGANMTCISPTYGYDNLNRLTSASETLSRNPSSGNGYSRNFSYDVYGNMSVSAYLSNVPASPLMPLANQNPFNAANNRLNSSTYDARGNMTQVAAGSESMTYDGESRQIQTLDSGTGGTGTTNYLYDSAGQRVQKQVAGGATIVHVHDAFGQLVAEYNSAGITPVCTTCYLAYDQVGSVRLITDQKAGVVARHDYLPYGEEIPNGSAGRSSGNGFANNANLAQMFTGQERDGSTADLDYFNARHMSAYMGRFTQPDPGNAGANIMNPQTWNAYAYVLGNPLGYTDPSGLICSSRDVACVTGNFDDGPPAGFGGGGSLVPIYYPTDPTFYDTGYGKGNVDTIATPPKTQLILPLIPANNVAMVMPLMGLPQKQPNPQYCQSQAQKIANLEQTLRNKAYELETNPGNLPVEAPGPSKLSQWGHVGNYIRYQANLAAAKANYFTKCGGGPPPPVAPTAPAIAPANFAIPSWLLFLGGAAVIGTEVAPVLFSF